MHLNEAPAPAAAFCTAAENRFPPSLPAAQGSGLARLLLHNLSHLQIFKSSSLPAGELSGTAGDSSAARSQPSSSLHPSFSAILVGPLIMTSSCHCHSDNLKRVPQTAICFNICMILVSLDHFQTIPS